MGNTHDTQIARIEADYIGSRWRTMDDYRWGYCKDRGPETWWIYYPSASGGNQSPIDILTEDVHVNHELSVNPLQVHLCSHGMHPVSNTKASGLAGSSLTSSSLGQSSSNGKVEKKTLTNNGNTSIVEILDSKSYITGGPCKDYTFILERVELHWGETDSNGSEHLINSRPYSAEVHLIHWNEDLYDSYEEAMKKDEGIVIMAVFAKLTDLNPNKTLQMWSKLIEDVVYRDQTVGISEEFDVKLLLPDDTAKYWSYSGSYTCPPCHETVTWIVFSQTITISSQILNLFRTLRSYCENDVRPSDEYDGQIQKNCRPIQPLGTRKICSPEIEIIRRRPKSYEGLLQEQTTVRVSIFPELFDPQRREELFKWLQ